MAAVFQRNEGGEFLINLLNLRIKTLMNRK